MRFIHLDNNKKKIHRDGGDEGDKSKEAVLFLKIPFIPFIPVNSFFRFSMLNLSLWAK